MRRHLYAFLALCCAALPSFAAITGIVMTSDGQPIAGARVSIRNFESTEAMRARLLSASPEAVPLASTQTDAKGAFTLESPKESTVDLSIVARGYEPAHRRVERDEEIGAIALTKTEMRKGAITAGGKPVPNALVVVTFGGYEHAVRTDAQGRYEAPDPKRARSVIVVHPDYAVVEEAYFTMNTSASALNRVLAPGNALKGRVVGDNDTPVALATVFVDGWPLATSAEDGTFAIAHMPLKWTSITARKDSLLGQRAFSKDASTTIRVAKAATITGRVTDSKTRVPVAGVVIRANTRRFSPGPDTSFTAITDAKGTYSITVPAGTYSLFTTHPGYDVRMTETNAVAGQAVSKDLSLAPLARVTGTVIDESKRPVVVASLDTQTPENMRFGGPMRMMRGGDAVVSGPDGRFSMRVQPDQEQWVIAVKRGLPPGKSETFTAGAGERKSGVTITIPSGLPVTGKVVDANGDPLSGVAVTATEADPGQRGMFRMMMGGPMRTDDQDVRTASDGTFTMRVKEGTYDFGFTREGLAPTTVRAQNVTAAAATHVEATMQPAAEISGRVTRDGAGVENVMISAMAPGSMGNFAVTGPDGSFTISGLAPGNVRLMARKEDDFIQEARSVTAPAKDVLIELRAGGRISGRVVEKGSGKPITAFQAGVTTSRGGGGGMVMMGPPLLRSFTSDDGSFTLESVPAGAMVVTASAPGYASSRLNINVEEGKEVTGLELQLDTGVKLIGRVTGPNGAPISDVQVRITPSPSGNFSGRAFMDAMATTDANGEYSIDGLEAGEESVSFMHGKHSSIQKSVTLKGRETRLDAQLTTGGRVSGVVVTEAGAPVADAQVEAYSSTSMETARTNANGEFSFESVAPGRYRFSANKVGLAEGVLTDVDVSTGAPVRIVMKTGGTIYGRITGLTPQELTQAQVMAAGQSMAAGSIDPQGNYRIEGVPSGTVEVYAMAGQSFMGSSRRSPSQTVEMTPGGSQQVDIAFRGDIVISGRITRNGAPMAGGQVNFFPRGNSTRGTGSTVADNDGRYSVTGLEEGEYNVMVSDSTMRSLAPYQTTYQVRGTTTFDIDYRTNSLRGRAVDVGTNEPLANVSVSVRNAGTTTDTPRFTRGAITDATGAFIIDSISPGNYTVTATKNGYSNDTKELYVGESSAPQDLEMRLARNPGVVLTVVDARDGQALSARAVAFDPAGRVADETRMMFGGGDAGNVTLNIAPGPYTVTVSASGYAPQSVTVQSPSNVTVRLSPGGTVEIRSRHNDVRRVRLIDANGVPYPRYSAMIPSRELLPNATLTIPNIASGAYTLQLLDRDVVVDSKRIVVTEGATTREEI